MAENMKMAIRYLRASLRASLTPRWQHNIALLSTVSGGAGGGVGNITKICKHILAENSKKNNQKQ